MAELQTKYMGIVLKSPIIAGSCGLTADIEKMAEMERAGVGAVILKSIFEEQIREESKSLSTSGFDTDTLFPGAADYVKHYIRSHNLNKHVELVREAKKRLTVPVIASISCSGSGEWVSFARELEQAGADALELNMFLLPTDEFASSESVENRYYDTLKAVCREVKIPVSMKIGRYFTNLSAFVDKLKGHGAAAVTLFNRFYEPDIDVERMSIGAAPVFSSPAEIRTTLRWTGILAGKDNLQEISSTTGVHDGEAVVKLLLAGATTVQVCSVLYQHGIESIAAMNRYLSDWMDKKGFERIGEMRGLLSYSGVESPELYERAQFMKYFSSNGE